MIYQLLRSNSRANILLAIELAKGQGVDLEVYWHKVQELYNSMDSRRVHSPNVGSESAMLEDWIYFLTIPVVDWSYRYAFGGEGNFERDLGLLAELRQVRELNLYYSKAGYLPDNIVLLKELEHLDAVRTLAERLPENFGELQALNTLILDDNNLSDLPDSFANLQSIKHLSLAQNSFSDIPRSLLPLLPQLEYLDFSDNPLLSKAAKSKLEERGFAY